MIMHGATPDELEPIIGAYRETVADACRAIVGNLSRLGVLPAVDTDDDLAGDVAGVVRNENAHVAAMSSGRPIRLTGVAAIRSSRVLRPKSPR